MAGAPIPFDSIVANVYEQLAVVGDAAEACSIVADRIGGLAAARTLVLLHSEAGLVGGGSGISPPQIRSLIVQLGASGSPLLPHLQRQVDLEIHPFAAFPPLDFTAIALGTIGDDSAPPLGVVLLEVGTANDAVTAGFQVARRCAPALRRVLHTSKLEHQMRRQGRQRDLLHTVINALPDPVLITNARNDIALTNVRADDLFGSDQDDSDGRRRAIQVNNLLFSSFLTQSAMSGTRPRPAGRELNLVDAADGSDLLFEVLALPIDIGTGDLGTISVLRDITDLKRAVGELEVQFNRSRVAEHDARQERDRLNVILENVSDPILVTDEHSNIILMNPEADRLFVVSPDSNRDALSRHQVEANDTRVTTLISHFLLRPEPLHVERIAVIDPDTGGSFPAEVASSKIFNSRGEPTVIVSVIHDLTQTEENERLARELQQLNDQLEDRIRRATLELEERNRRLEWQSYELEKASRLKSEFLASMSHELRTPINVILGYTSLMRERIYGELTGQQDEALGKTYSTSQHLLELINDILDLSKIEAGKMPLHVEPVLVQDVIAEVAESVLPMLQHKRLDFTTDVERDLPMVHTDRTKVKQILLNLLSNAIKFTQQGGVSVAVSRAERGCGALCIVVADTGIGIKPEFVDSIFEDFRQIDQSRTREYGGTGLGLSITKKLLALLGGTVRVESEYGTGTRFSIELPDLEDRVGEHPGRGARSGAIVET